MRKSWGKVALVSFILVLLISQASAMVYTTAEAGTTITIYNMELWGKNDHDVTAPNFSQASVDPNNKIIKARAYTSFGIPFVSPTQQVASGYLGVPVCIRPKVQTINCRIRVTFDGSYNGLIGALGVAAGVVKFKGILRSYNPEYHFPAQEFTLLETGAGGLPSGAISGTFNKSFEVNARVGEDWVNEIKFEVYVASGTSTMKTLGVCDNDFYTDNRYVKLNWIKVENLGPAVERPGGGGGGQRYR